ncbi:MobA/MobL family protein (plasmid) [Priestia megaterium]|nr:MobA/MobL family protein [Priestia megaterium]USL45751.1 MobA/MobL family protein [Priestia megaterium]
MVADIAIHRDDANNPHAHVMLTMRTLDQDGFGKKNRDWTADFVNSNILENRHT